MASPERTQVERHNNLVFIAIVIALVLSFSDGNRIAFSVEVIARVLVVVLVGYGLATFRREYFSHWTSWLTLTLALASVLRLLQMFTVG